VPRRRKVAGHSFFAILSQMLAKALDWMFPSKCALCGIVGCPSICDACRDGFRRLDRSINLATTPLDYRVAIFHHELRAAQAVRRLKYSRVTSLASPLADFVKGAYDELGLDEVDAVVPVPIHWTRRTLRGFNQSELLSRALPAEKVHPELLLRTRRTRPQVGLDRSKRQINLLGAFRASDQVAGRSILLVDDVTTSGFTAEHCAQALKDKGASRVGLLTLTGEI